MTGLRRHSWFYVVLALNSHITPCVLASALPTFLHPSFVCVCMCSYVCMCVYIHLCISCVWRPKVNIKILPQLLNSRVFPRLPARLLDQISWAASPRNPLPPQSWISGVHSCVWLFTWVLGNQIQFTMLMWQVFYQQPPSPCFFFFFFFQSCCVAWLPRHLKSSFLSSPSTGIIGMYHQASHNFIYLFKVSFFFK